MRRVLLAFLVSLMVASGCGNAAESTEDPLSGRTFLLVTASGFDIDPGTTLQLTFADAKLSFRAGCNTHSGPYQVREGRLVLDGVGSTAIGCPQPQAAQDERLVTFLTSRPKLQLLRDDLTISDAMATLKFLDREVADTDRPLVGSWSVDTFIDGNAASSVALVTPPTLRFAAEGSFEVDTTCNTGGGRYEATGRQLTLSEVIYTEASCTGSSGFADVRVQAVLSEGPVRFSIDAARLTLERGTSGLVAVAR